MAYIDFSHGGNIYDFDERIIDFSANINPLGMSPILKKSIFDNLDRILHYPDIDAKITRQKIADHWKIDKDNILLGNGSAELIYLITASFNPKNAVIPIPTFSEYERALEVRRCKIKFLRLNEKEGFNLDLDLLKGADICFLCNPNNPTGNIFVHPDNINRVKTRRMIIDEAFMDFLPDQNRLTLITRAVKSKEIVVLRSLTKFFALPGLRAGYMVAHKETIKKIRRYQAPWSVNTLAQLATEESLKNREYIKETHALIKKERGYLFKELNNFSELKPYASAANFLLVRIKKPGITSKALKESLVKRNILIRDCSNFRNMSNKYFRIAIRNHENNKKLIRALREVLCKI